jgi:uncharacterized NAD(P)/FAD-binding protein YdhS
MDGPIAAGAAPAGGHAPARLPIAIVGAGFTGTIVALHLLRELPPQQHLLLCERGRTFGRGTAYGTEHHEHLLNVRAANMSAFTDQPDSFERWLRACAFDDTVRVRDTEVGLFAARSLYGRYLNAMLDMGMAGVAGTARLQLITDEVVDIEPAPGGWKLTFASGAWHRAAGVVLAVGNLPGRNRDSALYRTDPWAPGVFQGLVPGLPVLVIGTGLTAMDLVVAMHERGFPGPVLALSRRGLMPREHAPAAAWPRPVFTPAERASLLALLRRMRREVARAASQGVDWRGVIDSIRPDTAELWRGLPQRDRARFLRHLRPFWDVHRHRLAPPVAAQIKALCASGYLQVIRGRFQGVEPAEGAAVAIVKRRGCEPERITAQRIINATGVESAAHCEDRLLKNLLARRLVRLDATGLGIDVTDAFQVIDARGRAAFNLWALGPVVRGVFWECTAVPDIRVQAAALAGEMVR